MARKHRVDPPAGEGSLILPRELVGAASERPRWTAAEYSVVSRASREWFRAHGVDPGEWSAVYPVLKASWRAHGIESSSDRARRRFAEQVRREQ